MVLKRQNFKRNDKRCVIPTVPITHSTYTRSTYTHRTYTLSTDQPRRMSFESGCEHGQYHPGLAAQVLRFVA